MALPKIDVPIYEAKLISTGKTVRFRPFTVKEQKLFLMAAESQDADSSIKTIGQVLQNCILDDINIQNIPLFDIENLFLNLRARSVGEIVNLKYRCNNVVKDDKDSHECGNVVQVDLNVLEINPKISENHTSKIVIDDKMGLIMKYPTFKMIQGVTNEVDQTLLDMIVDCVDYIYDDEQIYYAKDTPRSEIVEFVESMQTKDLDKIKLFFDTMPTIEKDIDFVCNKCGYHEEIKLEGTESFFV
jgi:hypothetical protein